MKYKIGQKVRIIEWLDMPEDLQESYSINVKKLGEIGAVVSILDVEMGKNPYNVVFEGEKYPIFYFEEELEPIVRVGEQLMFAFMQTSGYQR